jgi:hypothetical protein
VDFKLELAIGRNRQDQLGDDYRLGSIFTWVLISGCSSVAAISSTAAAFIWELMSSSSWSDDQNKPKNPQFFMR